MEPPVTGGEDRGYPKNRTRIAVLLVGALCIALGGFFGWSAALQGSEAKRDAVGAADTAHASKNAASQAATASEGWAHVASGAYTLAKGENAQAQAARRQASEFAAKAEKAAAEAKAALAQAQAAAAAAQRAQPPARPAAEKRPPPRHAARPRPSPRVRALVADAKAGRPRDEGCRRAIIFERTAADAALSRQAAYNAAMSGFAMNVHCAEPQHSLNEAYLLAQRAAAETTLHVGDWRADLQQSDRLLALCTRRPEYRGALSDGCRVRLRKNEKIRQLAERQKARAAASR